jgi:hypothetical protein
MSSSTNGESEAEDMIKKTGPPVIESDSADNDSSIVDNMSVGETSDMNTAEASSNSSNDIGTNDNNELNENLSTDSEYNTAEEECLSDVSIPAHQPTRRMSAIPVNPEAHVDTNTAENAASMDQYQRIIQRRLQKTGYTYDGAMFYHARLDPSEIHPEDPRRIFKIFNILRERGLLSECKRVISRRATKEEILLVHNILFYRTMRDTRGKY